MNNKSSDLIIIKIIASKTSFVVKYFPNLFYVFYKGGFLFFPRSHLVYSTFTKFTRTGPGECSNQCPELNLSTLNLSIIVQTRHGKRTTSEIQNKTRCTFSEFILFSNIIVP
jgi:hypothetical protein